MWWEEPPTKGSCRRPTVEFAHVASHLRPDKTVYEEITGGVDTVRT
jgi:hypothetical protein